MGQGAHLCSRCGGTERITISDTESRCADCGLGASSARLVAIPDPSRTPEELAQLDRLYAEMMRRPDARFVDRPFPVYGLDDRFSGLRFYGGSGTSNGVTTELSLGFGIATDSDPDATQVRIATRGPQPVDGRRDRALERLLAVQSLLRDFAHIGGELSSDVRASGFPRDARNWPRNDPAAPWDEAEVLVDGVPSTARVLDGEDHWVGLVATGDFLVGINAIRWSFADTGLVEVTDFAPYGEGSAVLPGIMRRHEGPG